MQHGERAGRDAELARTSSRRAVRAGGAQHVVAGVAGLPDLPLEAERAAEHLGAGRARGDQVVPLRHVAHHPLQVRLGTRCSCGPARRGRAASAACRATSARSAPAALDEVLEMMSLATSTSAGHQRPEVRRAVPLRRCARPRGTRVSPVVTQQPAQRRVGGGESLGEHSRAVGVQAPPALEHAPVAPTRPATPPDRASSSSSGTAASAATGTGRGARRASGPAPEPQGAARRGRSTRRRTTSRVQEVEVDEQLHAARSARRSRARWRAAATAAAAEAEDRHA